MATTRNPLVLASGQVQQLQIGTDVADIGYPVMSYKNRIINGNAEIWQRGTSFSNPATGAYTADRWLVTFDGTGGTTVYSQLTLAVAEISGLEAVRYAYRYNCTSARSSATSNQINQRVEGVRHLAGKTVTISFWAKADSSRTLQVSATQVFGTGGTPSSNVTILSATSFSVTTTWTRFQVSVAVPSISGKTLGSNDNDYSQWNFLFPLNATGTFDITGVQLEIGPVATDFEIRPLMLEQELCIRYFKLANTDTPGACSNSSGTTIHTLITLRPYMRATPTATLSTTTPTFSRPGVGDVTGSGSTLTLGAATNTHLAVCQIDGFTGLTQNNITFLKVGSISLDAEL